MADNFHFEDNSKEVKGAMHQASEAGLKAVSLLIVAQAKALARVNTGEMRDKIDHKIDVNGSRVSSHIGSPSEHAIWNEYGTGEFATNGAGRQGGWSYQAPDGTWHHTYGMKPQPFLRPSFRQNKDNVKSILGKEYGARFGK